MAEVLGAYYKGCQSEVYGEREQLNPPDDKGCIYGLLGVALSAPATSSSQVLPVSEASKTYSGNQLSNSSVLSVREELESALLVLMNLEQLKSFDTVAKVWVVCSISDVLFEED
ncbi:hypothetical protein OROMI_018374 [Orobanche minor]